MADCPWRWRRTISADNLSCPTPAAQDHALGRASQLPLEPVPLGTHPVDVVEHSFQQRLGRGRRYASPLKLVDFAALPMDLGAHPFDFGSDAPEWQAAMEALILVATLDGPTMAFDFTKPRF